MRIDFYILEEDAPDAREIIACRLAEKAWQKDHRVFVPTPSTTHAERFDELLWTFRQNSFVPHELYRSNPHPGAPVLVGDGSPPEGHADVLINLSQEVPAFFRQFTRVAEIIASDPSGRAAGRERFRYYRAEGCEIDSHNV